MKRLETNTPKSQDTHLEYDAHLLENEVWLTTEEAMAHLNVSRSTIYRLRKQHNIPSFKLGHIPIYPKHLLNKLLIHGAISHLKKH